MDTNPLISAVIPVYNRRDLVVRAVESVAAQTYARWECVVVDDGSDDGTWDVLQQVREGLQRPSRLKLIRQENQGVSTARNRGIVESEGTIIALLDSDDYWLSRKLERQWAFMRSRGHAVCQTEEIWIRKGVRVNPMNKHAKPEGRFFQEALEMCLVSPSCVMFRRDFFDEIGPFDETLPACEDYDLWLRALLGYDIGLLQEPLTIKEGGRPDQLSVKIIGLDLYRIYSMLKLLRREDLTAEQRHATMDTVRRKAGVYIQGCLKRHKFTEAQRVGELLEQSFAAAAVKASAQESKC